MEVLAIVLGVLSIGANAVLAVWITKLNLKRNKSQKELTEKVERHSEILRNSKA